MSELEPFAFVNAGGERYGANCENTSVYQHLGKLALYDNVFVQISEKSGIYVWKHNPRYDSIATLAVENTATLHLNLREVSELDLNAYDKFVLADLKKSDGVPESWVQ